jgi:predicted transposase YbfD/YdcC
MGCQREIAARIIEKGGDYLLAVKGNQGCLEEDAGRTPPKKMQR